jgi:hypothetical protein
MNGLWPVLGELTVLAAANSSAASYPPDSLRSKEDDIYIVTMLLLDMGLRLDKGMASQRV